MVSHRHREWTPRNTREMRRVCCQLITSYHTKAETQDKRCYTPVFFESEARVEPLNVTCYIASRAKYTINRRLLS